MSVDEDIYSPSDACELLAAVIGATRLADNAGDYVGTIPDFSLLNDYYPVEQRGKAFALYGTLRRGGALVAPWIVALVVLHFGWRLPFRITGPLLILAGIIALFFLRNVLRDLFSDAASSVSNAPGP